MSRSFFSTHTLTDFLVRGPSGEDDDFGPMFLASDQKTGATVLLRSCRKKENLSPSDWQRQTSQLTAHFASYFALSKLALVQPLFATFADSDRFYIAVQHTEGVTLRNYLRRNGSQSFAWAKTVFLTVASVLQEAHAYGLPHLGLTPHRILLSPDGRLLCVTDFGLAPLRPHTTSPYIAPEQIAILPSQKAGPPARERVVRQLSHAGTHKLWGVRVWVPCIHRGETTPFPGNVAADVFTLALLMCEMLTGTPLFSGRTTKALHEAICQDNPALPANLPPEWNVLLSRMLAKDPSARPSFTEILSQVATANEKKEPQNLVASLPPPTLIVRRQVVEERKPSAPSPVALSPATISRPTVKPHSVRPTRRPPASSASRRYRSVFIVGVCLLLLVGLAMYSQHLTDDFQFVTVASVQGKTTRTAGARTVPLRAGDRFDARRQPILSTPKNGKATLSLRGAILHLSPRTKLEVRELDFDRATVRRFVLYEGAVMVQVERQRGPYPRFEIAAQGVRVRVTGTRFGVQVLDKNQGILVATADGVVQVDTAPFVTTAVGAGKQTKVWSEQETVTVVPLTSAGKRLLTGFPESSGQVMAFRTWQAVEDATILNLTDAAQAVAGWRPFTGTDESKALTDGKSSLVQISTVLTKLQRQNALPAKLTLESLEELPLSEGERRKLLNPFRGKHLIYYRRTKNGFQVAARIRDTRGTVLYWRNGKLTARSPEEVGTLILPQDE